MTVMFSDALRREINFVSLGKRHRGILEQPKRKPIMMKRRQNVFFSAVIHRENLDRAGTDSLSRPVCQKDLHDRPFPEPFVKMYKHCPEISSPVPRLFQHNILENGGKCGTIFV